MRNIKKVLSKYLPSKSLLGFRILTPLESIIISYLFIFVSLYLKSFFGFQISQLISGSFFIILINISIIILIINSVIRLKKVNFIFQLFEFFLIAYLPFSLKKIIIAFSILYSIYFDN